MGFINGPQRYCHVCVPPLPLRIVDTHARNHQPEPENFLGRRCSREMQEHDLGGMVCDSRSDLSRPIHPELTQLTARGSTLTIGKDNDSAGGNGSGSARLREVAGMCGTADSQPATPETVIITGDVYGRCKFGTV